MNGSYPDSIARFCRFQFQPLFRPLLRQFCNAAKEGASLAIGGSAWVLGVAIRIIARLFEP